MRTIVVGRYVTPLREGGSLPALVEGDDDGLYVLKFRGAGQGPKALIAEVIAGGIARALGLAVPEIVLAELDPDLARTEPDPEIQELIRASAGTNVALDFLPGSINFDPAVDEVDAGTASRIVWFDAFVSNVDRSARNTNLLVWHGRPWLIDHGAALYFHHGWDGDTRVAARPFPMIAEHVLLPRATELAGVDAASAAKLDEATLATIIAAVPDVLFDDADGHDPARRRAAYLAYFLARLARRDFVREAIDARR
ncbi:HipA family kinase [Arenimonas composti]|uniref:HipA family kinase n=1 Tax=Arenimonas composti TaxID=370776 RepID=UPI00047C31E0|nr:HipA family kinase [Arenimonas composti]